MTTRHDIPNALSHLRLLGGHHYFAVRSKILLFKQRLTISLINLVLPLYSKLHILIPYQHREIFPYNIFSLPVQFTFACGIFKFPTQVVYAFPPNSALPVGNCRFNFNNCCLCLSSKNTSASPFDSWQSKVNSYVLSPWNLPTCLTQPVQESSVTLSASFPGRNTHKIACMLFDTARPLIYRRYITVQNSNMKKHIHQSMARPSLKFCFIQ